MLTVQTYVPNPRGRGPSHKGCTMISCQGDGWNHLRPSEAILKTSGLRVGDGVKITLNSRGVLKFEKDVSSQVTVKKYPYGNGVQISWRNDLLDVRLSRGHKKSGHAFPGTTASRGSITVQLIWE